MGLLEDKVAIITGSGRGIGKAAALMFAEHGASVVVNDLDPEPAEETVKEITDLGHRAVICAGNIVDEGLPDRLMGAAMDNFGKIDILVNNAGYTWDGVIQKMTDEQWYALIDVHATAPFRLIRAISPYMRDIAKKEIAEGKRVHRKIINICSLAGIGGNAGQVNYSAAKAALIGVTKAIAKEWGGFNINVNAVCFGHIYTRLTVERDEAKTIRIENRELPVGVSKANVQMLKMLVPLRRGGTPQEAAGPILFLASPLSDYITGEVIICSGGLVI